MTPEERILQRFDEYFQNATPEEIAKEVAVINALNNEGITYEEYIYHLNQSKRMRIDKQPAPKESGPYMVSDHGTHIWTPATYNAVKKEWQAFSTFHPDGWYVIPEPDLWMDKE